MAQIYTQVKLATWQDIDLGATWALGVDSLDGVLVTVGDRILVKSQSDRTQNGIYVFDAYGVLHRASDFAQSSTQTGGAVVFVQQGDIHADTGWVLSSDGSLTVGTDYILFEKFSVNLKLQGADVPSSIVLRQEKGYPLTNDELDNNFKYLAITLTQKLNIVDYTSISVRDKINALSAAQGNLNAWKLQDNEPSVSAGASTIALRDDNSDLYAIKFHGDLVGNADTADNADYASVAHELDAINPVVYGGTGADNASDARDNLQTVWTGGDTMTGQLVLPSAQTGFASLRIPPKLGTPEVPVNGDIWSDNEYLYYHMNNRDETLARTHSPSFTGSAIYDEVIAIESNSTAIANTAYVQKHRTEINTALDLKAPIADPVLTGTPKSVTAATDIDTTGTNKTMIATVEYVAKKIAKVLEDYSTTAQVASAITTALTSYYTKTQTDTAITDALKSYYTKTNIDTTFNSYSTSTQVDTKISDAIANRTTKTYVDDLQDKWGSSKKYVQSSQPTDAVDGDIWFKI